MSLISLFSYQSISLHSLAFRVVYRRSVLLLAYFDVFVHKGLSYFDVIVHT
jgi:hypothetical protein